MTSKDALELIWDEVDLKSYECNGSTIGFLNLLEIIKEDLERLEELEEENKELKELFKKHFIYSCKSHTIRKRTTNFDYEILKGVLENG